MTLEEFKRKYKDFHDTFLGKESSNKKEQLILEYYQWELNKIEEDKQFNVTLSLNSIINEESINKINSLVNLEFLEDNEFIILNLPSFDPLTLLKVNSKIITPIQTSNKNISQIEPKKLYEQTFKIVNEAKEFKSQFHTIDGALTIIISKNKICFKHGLHLEDTPLKSFFSTLGFY